MSSPFETSQSHHPRQKNIHGKEGCLTAEGTVCTACCQFFEVKPLRKPKAVPCEHMICGGCAIHNQSEQPDLCREYHCSRETEVLLNPLLADQVVRQIAFDRIVGLLETARALSQIGEAEFQLAYHFWLKAKENTYVFGDE